MESAFYYMLRSRIENSYNELIVVRNADILLRDQAVIEEIFSSLAVHWFRSEMELRIFLSSNPGKRVLILVPGECSYFPYDIEKRADIIELLDQPHGYVQESGLRSRTEMAQLVERLKEFLAISPVNWQEVAPVWGELCYLRDGSEVELTDYYFLDKELTEGFTSFVLNDYDKLFYESYNNGPVTINQVMPYLGARDEDKMALLCFDGMGFQEWYVLKAYLAENQITKFTENSIYAIVPSLTWSSRAALFSGQAVLPTGIVNEKRAFESGVTNGWKYGRAKEKGWFLNTDSRWDADYLQYEYLGLVFTLIDKHAHSAILIEGSKRGMQLSLTEFLPMTDIALLISHLLEENYRIYITSDHGTVWCSGNGYRADKYLVEERARRVLIYPNEQLARDFARDKDVDLYTNLNLLSERVLVLPRGRDMFSPTGEMAISHGGIHIEEIIIPFVEVAR